MTPISTRIHYETNYFTQFPTSQYHPLPPSLNPCIPQTHHNPDKCPSPQPTPINAHASTRFGSDNNTEYWPWVCSRQNTHQKLFQALSASPVSKVTMELGNWTKKTHPIIPAYGVNASVEIYSQG
jgi:hypothetical protein